MAEIVLAINGQDCTSGGGNTAEEFEEERNRRAVPRLTERFRASSLFRRQARCKYRAHYNDKTLKTAHGAT